MKKNNENLPVIGLCAANKIGFEAASFAVSKNKPLSFIATCDKDETEFEERIADIAKKHGITLFRRIHTQNEEFLAFLQAKRVDLVILAWWPSIVKKEAIGAVRIGFLNMHPSLLPYGRGKHPYYWAITEGTPFGATLQLVDEKVDSGPILFQKEIPVEFEDTGESLYKKGSEGVLRLFKENYDNIFTLHFNPQNQDNSKATFHLASELDPHSHIMLDKRYVAADLINRIRGRTFMDGNSAYVVMDGEKYMLKLIIEKA